MSCTGAETTNIYIANIDLKGESIPSIEGRDMVYRIIRRNPENHSIINGHSIVEYYTFPCIYEVDGVLEEDKKKLTKPDIRDTTYFQVLKPRETKNASERSEPLLLKPLKENISRPGRNRNYLS